MISSNHDDERQVQSSLGTNTDKDRTPRYSFSLWEWTAFWLILQLVFFILWGIEIFWNSGILWLSFAWLMFNVFGYLCIDILNGYYEAGAKREERKLVSLECTHCGALYAYPESSVDSTDSSVECQNCAKRFQVDTWKDIKNN